MKKRKNQKLLSFQGRIDSSKYLLTLAILIGCAFASSIIVFILGDLLMSRGIYDTPISLTLLILYLITMILWVVFAAGAKRCHDIGKSGWWQLIPFYFVVLMFKKGQSGDNEYGVNPKGK